MDTLAVLHISLPFLWAYILYRIFKFTEKINTSKFTADCLSEFLAGFGTLTLIYERFLWQPFLGEYATIIGTFIQSIIIQLFFRGSGNPLSTYRKSKNAKSWIPLAVSATAGHCFGFLLLVNIIGIEGEDTAPLLERY